MGNILNSENKVITGTIEYEDGKEYTGQIIDDTPNGAGEMYYPSGAKLVGNFKSGIINNINKVLYDDGVVVYVNKIPYTFVSNLVNKKIFNPSAKHSLLISFPGTNDYLYTNDEVYPEIGQIKICPDHKLHYTYVKGIYVYNNFVIRNCYTENGEVCGIIETPEYIYTGEIKNGKMNGNGEIKYKSSGNIYKGEFANGRKLTRGLSITCESGFTELYDVEIYKKAKCAKCAAEKPTYLFNNCGHKCVCGKCVVSCYDLVSEHKCLRCQKNGKLIQIKN